MYYNNKFKYNKFIFAEWNACVKIHLEIQFYHLYM